MDRLRLGLGDALGLECLRRFLATQSLRRGTLLDCVLLGIGEPLGLVLLGVGVLTDGGIELELLAFDLLICDPDVLNLELHLARLDGLGIGDIDLLLDRGDLEAERLVGFGDFGVDPESFLLFLLPRLLLLDRRVPIRVGRRDTRVLQRLLNLGLTKGVEIAFVVLNRLEDKGAELESHPFEIDVSLFPHFVLEELLFAVEFLHGQGADNAAQVARDSLLDGCLHIIHRHPQKTLGGTSNVLDIALDLDLRHRLDVDRDALNRVDMRQIDLESHHP